MPQSIHVLHYINQFFAGIGGEGLANSPVELRPGPVGPGRLLQEAIGAAASVKATIVCGDNFFNDQRERASARVREILREVKPDVVVAGPAFEAGRYGVACTEVCAIAQGEGIPAVTAMHPENPGVLLHRRDVTIVPTGKSPVEMPAAIRRLALLGLKLARGEALESAEVEGYLPRGIRRLGRRDRPGYERAVDMLVAKLAGRPFVSEVPYQAPESVVPAPPVQDLRTVSIALVTTGGLVPKGNPEGQTSGNPQRFYGYSAERLERMRPGEWEAYHAGYFTHIVDANPDYVLPLGFIRQLEAAGVIGGISPKVYTLPGVSTPVARSRQLGLGIAEELRKVNAGGCILVPTCGTCNRCGATIAKEIERAGIPVAMISAIYDLALTTGANRVVRGCRIEHVCGNPELGPEKDRAYGLQIVRTALRALQTPVDRPTLFDPLKDDVPSEVRHEA